MTQRETLVRDNVETLNQVADLLGGLSDDAYSRPEPRLASTGVGSHVRHCLDFYTQLARGLESGRVDYDGRQRDERVERDRAYAIERLRVAADGVHGLASLDGHVPLEVRLDAGGGCPDEGPWTVSSLDRELQALASHTVHHSALIAMLLRLAGHDLPEGFGVAPSTLRHWREQRACAR